MRFGGHETFAVREDWLVKGLDLLNEDADAFKDPFVSDRLGVGRNMAKSIRHWLQVTGLVETKKNSRSDSPTITPVGKTIQQNDRYFLHLGTWWVLHINLVTCGTDAVAWYWFFNQFSHGRFDRIRCSGDLQRQLAVEGQRPPSPKTLSRDIACLLSSYATPIPPTQEDPEDGHECPFRSLGLITYLRESDTYQLNRRKKDVPFEIVGYAFAIASPEDEDSGDFFDLNLSEAIAKPKCPGRTLALDADALINLLGEAEEALGTELIHTHTLGGERFVRVRGLSPSDWLEKYYLGAGR